MKGAGGAAAAGAQGGRRHPRHRGHFKPSVEGRETPGGGFAVVVDPGPRTTIADVELHFSGAASGAAERLDALRAAWALPVGQPFRQADWDAAKQQLLDGLSLRDYAAAAITASEALIDPESASARLRVEIDSGPASALAPSR
jgi:translocation and assembly module TamA